MKHTLPIKANIHNRFDIEVVRDGKTVQKAFAENIILDALWARMLAPNTWNSYIFFGVGTGTLSAARTSLFSHLGYKANTSRVTENHYEDGYISCRHMIQLAPEEYVDQELSEVGIGYGTASTNLVTHATLKDMNGNPTTIEKTALDIINIYATVYLQVPTSMSWESGGIALPINLNETGAILNSCGLLAYIFGRAVYTADLTRFRFLPMKRAFNVPQYASTSASLDVAPTITLSAINKTLTAYYRIGVNTFNVQEGVGCAEFMCGQYNTAWKYHLMAFSIDFTNPAIYPGSTIEGEKLGVGDDTTGDFQTAYQIKPGSTPVVKVDGTPVSSGITIDVGKPVSDNIRPYIRTIGHDCSGASYPWYFANWDVSSNAPRGPGGDVIFENTLYETYGYTSITCLNGAMVKASTDMEVWEDVLTASGDGDKSVPIAYKNYRYWRAGGTGTTGAKTFRGPFTCGDLTGNTANIHFDTPPAVGAVITVDYVTPWVAKDTNHVFDFTLELQFGEYTP